MYRNSFSVFAQHFYVHIKVVSKHHLTEIFILRFQCLQHQIYLRVPLGGPPLAVCGETLARQGGQGGRGGVGGAVQAGQRLFRLAVLPYDALHTYIWHLIWPVNLQQASAGRAGRQTWLGVGAAVLVQSVAAAAPAPQHCRGRSAPRPAAAPPARPAAPPPPSPACTWSRA